MDLFYIHIKPTVTSGIRCPVRRIKKQIEYSWSWSRCLSSKTYSRSRILLSQDCMSAINFPMSSLRREGTNLKSLDSKLFYDVVNILDDLLKISHCSEKSELLYTPFVCYLYFVYCWLYSDCYFVYCWLYSDCYIDKASHCWWLRENVDLHAILICREYHGHSLVL